MPVTGNGTARTGLGGSEGYGEIMLPRSDDGSLALDPDGLFDGGLDYFGTHYDASDIYVNTNGTLSFGAAVAAYPTAGNALPALDLIAPFWGDVDTRLDGEGAESGAVWVDLDAGSDTLTVTWADVGVYRRIADQTNLFQLQLIGRGGGDFDIVFRYERIEWTIGTGVLDVGARAGLVSDLQEGAAWLFEGANDPGLTALPDSPGNSGVSGLWVYEMRDGAVEGLVLTAPEPDPPPDPDPDPDPVPDPDPDPGPTGLVLNGSNGDDRLQGGEGPDTITGGDGSDELIGLGGDDLLRGGGGVNDLRDNIYGGLGDDSIEGGYGNDELRGDAGNDTLIGGFGADTVLGGEGNDNLTAQAWGDLLFGGDGNDFINGGYGYDRVNGGAGADVFFHLGVAGHGSDWIQDFTLTEGDRLQFGGSARAADFQVNIARTPNAGSASVEEAFVIYRPTGQILWALVDGGDLDHLPLLLGDTVHDLLG